MQLTKKSVTTSGFGFLLIVALVLVHSVQLLAQRGGSGTAVWLNNKDARQVEAPSVFLDCRRCDRSYIRREITFVNYVRDRVEADVHLLMVNQTTGGGGQSYVLDFIGQNRFGGLGFRLGYVSNSTDTWDQERQGLGHIMQAGLIPFASQTKVGNRLTYLSRPPAEEGEIPGLLDPWNGWVFDVGGSGSTNIEASRQSVFLNGDISANRTTERWRIRTSLYGRIDQRRFETNDGAINSSSRRSGINGTAVRSISGHLSVGMSANLYTSTYSNIDGGTRIAPAMEYSWYPYDEALRRELTFAYRIGYRAANYIERTIFDKMSEAHLDESLTIRLNYQQPWGSLLTTLEGSHYFHDLTKNRVEFFSRLRLRVTRGLSVRFTGRAEIIHDQLNLPAGEASLEEILLSRKQLATAFLYSASIGVGYTFGSIFNNVVNTRL